MRLNGSELEKNGALGAILFVAMACLADKAMRYSNQPVIANIGIFFGSIMGLAVLADKVSRPGHQPNTLEKIFLLPQVISTGILAAFPFAAGAVVFEAVNGTISKLSNRANSN